MVRENILQIVTLAILTMGYVACGKGSSNITGATPGSSSSETVIGGNGTVKTRINRAPQTGGNFLNNFPTNQIVSGGVPKDGIPALTDPPFVSVTSADFNYLRDEDLVLGVVINGEAKAYPHNMGWWHEIVNDVIGGQPIVVSFCPLTGTGLVFDGGTSSERLTCGVSGLLFNNNLIMYDRRDGSTLYPQLTYSAIAGPPGGGGELRLLPVIETTFRYWKKLYPNSSVISSRAGYSPSKYQSYPYGDYRAESAPPLFSVSPNLTDNPTAQIFPPKMMTLGVRFGEMAKAYPFATMGDEAVINDRITDRDLVVVFYGKEHYAVPFLRTVPGQTLTFEKVASTDPIYPFMMKDTQTGSVWNLKGEAVSGTLQGTKLEQVPAHNAFWFAWATFWRNTGIY